MKTDQKNCTAFETDGMVAALGALYMNTGYKTNGIDTTILYLYYL